MEKANTTVFVEVRYRSNSRFGSGGESIDKKKQQRIMKTALYYLKQQRVYQKMDVRFDVVSIDGAQHIDWIPHAFDWDY